MREQFHPLENRVLFSGGMVYSVTTTADSGGGSLREAILEANVHAGADTIEFHIGSGLRTISPASDLPAVTDPVIIDATTQGGYTPGRPLIQLNGAGVPATSAEIALDISAGNSTVKGLIFTNWGHGGHLQETLYLHDGGNNIVTGNWFGVDPLFGSAAAPNGNGIVISGSANNRIGGAADAERNVISGSLGRGVLIRGAGATGNLVQGNLIGTDILGRMAVPNGVGITLDGAANNTIGNGAAGNLIDGNRSYGVEIGALFTAGDARGNLVAGNTIGGMPGNGLAGIVLAGGAHDNQIGGTDFGTGNRLSSNGVGVLITDNSSGLSGLPAARDNTVQGNDIFYSTGDGILIANSPGNVIGVAGHSNSIAGSGGNGIHITGVASTANRVRSNFIGDIAIDEGNELDGIRIENAPTNLIGGVNPDDFNAIVSNGGNGIDILSGAGNTVQGNIIGLGPVGGTRPNGLAGVFVSAPSTLIGGAVAGARNIIVGNFGSGVTLARGADNSQVSGNDIGSTGGSSGFGNGMNGIYVDHADGVIIGGLTALERNVISSNQGDGIFLNTSNATVQGNFIGTDAAGTSPRGNNTYGVQINGGGNTVGGSTPAARNIISGNLRSGIQVDAGMSNNIMGNFIGTDITGSADLGNAEYGVVISGTRYNGIGGVAAGEGNLISGNDGGGILLSGGGNNTVINNRIGLAFASDTPVGDSGDGITVGLLGVQSSGNIIGGAGAGQANVIAGNRGNGVAVVNGVANAIFGNSIFSNGLLGIDLGPAGVTANDPNDTDTGANDLQNFPVITNAYSTRTLTVARGTLNSAPGFYYVDVYASPVGDPSGHGQGKIYLGFANCTVDATMTGSWTRTFTTPIAAGYVLSATATSSTSGTSEFSADAIVADAIPPTVVDADFPYLQGPVHRLNFQFSENVGGSISFDDFTITNLNTGAVVPLSGLGYNTLTNTAIPFLGGILPDGNYRATLHAAGINDAAGNQLDGNGDGAPSDDYTLDFYFLNADANRDRTVGFPDLVTLAQHYGMTDGNWSHGDFNYDGTINFNDLVILAQRYGTTLPAFTGGVHSPAPTSSPVVSASPTHDLLVSSSFAAKNTFSTKPIRAVLDDVVAHRPPAPKRHK
jgi:hypothetical protein